MGIKQELPVFARAVHVFSEMVSHMYINNIIF